MKTRLLLCVAPLALLAGCASEDLKIREVGAVHRDSSDGTTNGRMAIGLGQLRLGNVGLALETFRRAAREDPSSAEALAGLAECYQRMGRPTLSRRYLEQALALRPQEPGLYRALAVVSESEGKTEEATALRKEAELRAEGKSAAAQKVSVDLHDPTPAASMPAPTVTVDLAPPRPAPSLVAKDEVKASGPRLVRVSLGEVMLITGGQNPFKAAQMIADDTVHAPLRVLNAARIQGIAARTRALLAARGIRGIDIGDAPSRQASSELHYAAGQRERAERVAACLPFAVRLVERNQGLVLLVGRDAGSST